MASVNISLTREAYSFLKMLKGRDKSFSDVVLEFKSNGLEKRGTGKGILKYLGILKNTDIKWDEVKENLKLFKSDFNKRIEREINDRY